MHSETSLSCILLCVEVVSNFSIQLYAGYVVQNLLPQMPTTFSSEDGAECFGMSQCLTRLVMLPAEY